MIVSNVLLHQTTKHVFFLISVGWGNYPVAPSVLAEPPTQNNHRRGIFRTATSAVCPDATFFNRQGSATTSRTCRRLSLFDFRLSQYAIRTVSRASARRTRLATPACTRRRGARFFLRRRAASANRTSAKRRRRAGRLRPLRPSTEIALLFHDQTQL